MAQRTIEEVLNELASLLIFADHENIFTEPSADNLLHELGDAIHKLAVDPEISSLVDTCRTALDHLRAGKPLSATKFESSLAALQRVKWTSLATTAHREVAKRGRKERPTIIEPFPVAVRDFDTVALMGEFLSESEEALTQVDATLITAERDGVEDEGIRSVFRAFHSIKGSAGFLYLGDFVRLAHAAESVLDCCRNGALELIGRPLELILDATASMRQMLRELRIALERGVEFVTAEPVRELAAMLEASIESTKSKSKEVTTHDVSQAIDVAPEVETAKLNSPSSEKPQTGMEDNRAEYVVDVRAPEVQDPKSPQNLDVRLRETIKIDVDRVDALVAMIGELVVVETMVVGAPELAVLSSSRLRNSLAQLAKVTRDLQSVGMRMRMVPVAYVFHKMARVARDVGRRIGKKVHVDLVGENTEMDRSMVEQITDPLLHMIRNTIDHGIETPDVRQACGKPEIGQIRLAAHHEGGSVVVEIADDGRGLNRDGILAKAQQTGLIAANAVLSDAEIYQLIFSPGFSTAIEVTEISGRGVGMDVVDRSIKDMRGRISIITIAGKGTTFRIVFPLTLAIIDGMLVSSGGERYIVPTLSVVESLKPDHSMLFTLAGRAEMIAVRGEILPIVRLDEILGCSGANQDLCNGLVVIVECLGQKAAIAVDEVSSQQQVVIKSLGSGLEKAKLISGAAILADGRVGLIVNVEQLVQLASVRGHQSRRDTRVVGSGAMHESAPKLEMNA